MEETSVPAPTLNRYWKLLNDPGFSPPIANLDPPVVSTEAFLGLTHQVQNLTEMMQTIVPHIPQLMQTHNEVQKEFVKSKEESDEISKGESSFISEIQDKPVPTNFQLLALETYDDSSDPLEHIVAFRA
ncbi:hypothetical protein GW17_00059845 [Ensete ventricosum]|nr:hypothetical protein GW17_00059845 [Ensete ventricosum]